MPEDATRDSEAGSSPRRGFLASLGAIALGAIAAAAPIATAAATLLDPLLKRGPGASLVRVTRLDAVPESGTPKKFTVEAARVDAWTTYQATPVGAVYLRRTPEGVEALNVVCPHAGCFVGLNEDGSGFLCPCHKSAFDLEGSIADPASPAPRPMDTLAVEVRNGDEVWVRFESFLPGRAEKTPT